MAKKKKPKKKPVEKPLLSDVGILHLENSFVPPTQESGLLTTVGGMNMEGQALVLAPNYGYGISASAVAKVLENQQKMVDPTPSNVVEVNGVKVTTIDKNLIELNKDFPMNVKPDANSSTDPETLSIAELVRHIGGAKDKPFMRSDVMEDLVEEGDKDKEDEGKENHGEDKEFYESLGIEKPVKKPVKVRKEKPAETTSEETAQDPNGPVAGAATTPKPHSTIDNTKSIADYYKTYCHYYFAAEPDPYSDTPLAFGKAIDASGESNKDEEPDQSIIELAKMAQRARKAMEAARVAAKVVYGPQPQQEAYYDPLPMEVVHSSSDEFMKNAAASMVEYWENVKENPRDFNRWTYLVQHAEDTKNLVECRKAYSAFLPLFPYCFGYWKRYADIEKGRMYYQRALSVLLQGLEFNPLSIDLWQSYLALFRDVYGQQEGFEEKMRNQYEKAIVTAGIEFRSDALWEDYMNWELSNKRLKNVFAIYRRIMMCPTRLYNRHWDNFKILVRDHHPRDFMEKTEYETLRKKGCKILGYRYREEPEYEPGEIVKTSKPEDKLMNHVKDKIIMRLEKSYKKLAGEADKRWDFEDKIKRPYFHVKPLDNAQLRNWEEYLNFEISEGNNDRIVLLFERCLIACALYERFWCKYARYLEKYHRQENHRNESVSQYFQKSSILKSFEVATRKEIIEEEELVATVTDVLKVIIDNVIVQEQEERADIEKVVMNLVDRVCTAEEQEKAQQDLEYLKFLSSLTGERAPEVPVSVSVQKSDDSVGLSGHSASTREEAELPHNSVEPEANDKDVSSLTSVLSVPVFSKARYVWQEVIRDVYKRACVVHCPRKPVLRLQWAAFEEEIGNIAGARQLIHQVLERFSNMLDARFQLIELERRANRPNEVANLCEAYLKEKMPTSEHSTLSFKYAKFLFKEQGKPDQALAVLRKALRKDKGNHLIYNYVFEICYSRFPSDRKGASAALELALQCKDISKKHKLDFLRRKVLFLQEHGELTKYRDALDQLYLLRDEVAKEQAAADAAKLQAQYASIAAYSSAYQQGRSQGVPIHFEPIDGSSVPDEGKAGDTLSTYKKVAPTGELLDLSSYGYSSSHPDLKMQENQSQSEYDKLLTSGYRAELQDKTYTRSKEAQMVHKRRRVPLYIVPPREEDQSDYYRRKRPRRDIRVDLMNKS